MRVVALGGLGILGAASLLTLVAVVRGRALADRAVAIDGLVSIVLSGLLVAAVLTEELAIVVTALVLGIVGFVGTTSVARYVERRGEHEDPKAVP